MINFNKSTGKYELIVNGRVVKRGSEGYVKTQARKMGLSDRNVEVAEQAVRAPVKSEFSVSERFEFIDTFVNMITKKTMTSLIITGDGGLGKTHSVIQGLKRRGLREDTIGEISGEFIVIKGYSTPKALYRTLWENNGKVIVFDDADSVHRDPIGSNLLKAALESSDKRVINWNAEFSDREELPNRFEFTGRVIFISNLPLVKFPQALLSRSMKVDLTLTTEEKLDRIDFVLNELRDENKVDVMKFLRKYADKITDLNVRSALNVAKLARTIDGDWTRIALYSVTA